MPIAAADSPKELQASLGIEVCSYTAARNAFAHADVVALATNANEKVMELRLDQPGQHLSSGFSELHPQLVRELDRVVVNRAEPWVQNYHLGELVRRISRMPRSRRAIRPIQAREFFRQRIEERAREKTLFPNEASNYQLGGQFAAVAGFVLDRAQEKDRARAWTVCPNTAARGSARIAVRTNQLRLAAEHYAAAGFGTGPGSIR